MFAASLPRSVLVFPRIGRYVVVAVKSTVVPGSTDGAVREEIERASSMRLGEFGLAMTPEFLREGGAVADFCIPTASSSALLMSAPPRS